MTYPYEPHATAFGNLDDVNENEGATVPAGEYTIRSTSTELRATKAGTGQIIDVSFEIVDGQYAGRRVRENFNVQNPNAQTMQIALRQLKQWLLAAGHPATGALTFERVQALEGVPVRARLRVEQDKSGQYEDQNRVARFLLSAGAGAPAGMPAQGGVMPSPAAGVTPPAAQPAATPPVAPYQTAPTPTAPPTVPTAAPGAAPAAPAHPAPPPAAPVPAAPHGAPAAPPPATHAAPPPAPGQPPAAPAAPAAAPGQAAPWAQPPQG